MSQYDPGNPVPETCPRCKGFVWHRSAPCNCPAEPTTPTLDSPVSFRLQLGQRLYAARRQRQLSLDQLAARAGMSKAGLWQIEQGHSEPRAGTVVALALALEVTTDALLIGGKR